MHEDVNLPLGLLKQSQLPQAKQILFMLANKALQLEDLNAFETYAVALDCKPPLCISNDKQDKANKQTKQQQQQKNNKQTKTKQNKNCSAITVH